MQSADSERFHTWDFILEGWNVRHCDSYDNSTVVLATSLLFPLYKELLLLLSSKWVSVGLLEIIKSLSTARALHGIWLGQILNKSWSQEAETKHTWLCATPPATFSRLFESSKGHCVVPSVLLYPRIFGSSNNYTSVKSEVWGVHKSILIVAFFKAVSLKNRTTSMDLGQVLYVHVAVACFLFFRIVQLSIFQWRHMFVNCKNRSNLNENELIDLGPDPRYCQLPVFIFLPMRHK